MRVERLLDQLDNLRFADLGRVRLFEKAAVRPDREDPLRPRQSEFACPATNQADCIGLAERVRKSAHCNEVARSRFRVAILRV